MRTKWLVRVPHKNLKWGNDLAKNRRNISYLISFSIQTLIICQGKTSDNYLLSMDSRAWLIAIPDKTPPAITPTELAVHWGCECMSSHSQWCPWCCQTPSGYKVAAPVAQLTVSLHLSCAKTSSGSSAPTIFLFWPSISAVPHGWVISTQVALGFTSVPAAPGSCPSAHISVVCCTLTTPKHWWDAEAGENGGGESKRDPPLLRIWEPGMHSNEGQLGLWSIVWLCESVHHCFSLGKPCRWDVDCFATRLSFIQLPLPSNHSILTVDWFRHRLPFPQTTPTGSDLPFWEMT